MPAAQSPLKMPENQIIEPNSTREKIINLIFLLSIFPFFRLIPLGSSETQPIACLIAAIHLLLLRKWTFPKSTLLPYLIVIIGYFFLGLAQYLLNPLDSFFLPAGIESTVIIFAPLIIFVALYGNLTLINAKILRICVYGWGGISFFQAFLPSALNATGITAILSRLISRFSSSSLGGVRGVTGFAPEPSYAAQVIILILAACIFAYKEKKIQRNEFLIMLASCTLMVFLNRSATIASFIAVFGLCYILRHILSWLFSTLKFQYDFNQGLKVRKKLLIFILIIALLVVSAQFNSFSIPESRISDLLIALSNLSSSNLNVKDILGLTNDLGSQRTLSVYAGYFNIISTNGVGSGLGSWSVDFLNTLEQANIDPSTVRFFIYNGFKNLKPYAYAGLVSFDMGILGLSTLSFIFGSLLFKKVCKHGLPSAFSVACLGCGIMMLYFNSLASLPTGWILIALGLHEKTTVESPNQVSAIASIR